MAYFVKVSFDISNGTREDYQTIYRELESMGLHHSLTSENGTTIALPSTTVAGAFNGQNAAGVRDDISTRVQSAYSRSRIHGNVFVAVGGGD